jgi:hypothetical protein
MLVQEGFLAGSSLSFLGGGAAFSRQTARARHGWSIANARAFNSGASFPQGYNSPTAIKMPLNTGGNVSARFFGNSAFSAAVFGSGELGATLEGDGSFAANGQMGAVIYATMEGETTLTAQIEALGNMAARLDAGARPSAFDIAQETWQAKASSYNAPGTMGAKVNAAGGSGDPWAVTLEGSYTAADLLRIAAAVLAGKVSGMETGNPVFRSVDDAKDRVTAETTPDGNRTTVVLDGD